jgi:hypothetical protein
VPPLINRRPRQKGREPAGWYPAPPTTNAGEIREHWAIRAECLCARRSDPADAVRIHQDKLGPAGVDAQLRSKPTSSNGTAELPWPWMAPFLKAKHDCDRWVAFGRPKRSSGTRMHTLARRLRAKEATRHADGPNLTLVREIFFPRNKTPSTLKKSPDSRGNPAPRSSRSPDPG